MPDTITDFAAERAVAEPVQPPLREALSVPPSIRYQVRPVLWGARARYEVRDTVTGSTLAVRTTRRIADGDVLVLNLGGRSGLRPRLPGPARSVDAAGPPGTELTVGHHGDHG